MSPQDETARDPARLHAEPWAAESPFVGEAAAEEQAPIDPWYQGYTPFVEGRELEEMYAPEAEWESDPAALEAESSLQSVFEQGRTSLIKPEELEEKFVMEEDLRFQRPECLDLVKKITRVAVVGGGLAGLMAARRLSQFGVKVTVFEAYKEVGGRVRSNTEFSNGRITEEGAELIGSFHTKWLGLARKYGLAVVSRMDPDLYQRAGLDVKLTLDQPLSMAEFKQLGEAMEKRVLKPIAKLAKQIRDPSRPWQQDELKKYDGMSVQDALPKYCKIAKRTKGNKDERLWKMIEFKLVNDEVAPLDEMNFLGLLCKVRGGQGERFGAGLHPDDMGYWEELEIFRCADGCQRLATEMAAEIKTKPGCRIDLNTKVTSIDILKNEVKLTWVPVRGGKPTLGSGQTETFAFVILAIPPSVWDDVIKVDGKNPRDKPGLMSMAPAVKFFSDVKERFWIKEKAAPYGGSLTLGQVWEGTDNQTRVEVEICGPQRRPQKVKQGIVLSVFTGPILPGRRVPTTKQFTDGLKELYPTYDLTPGTGNVRDTRFANWPDEPFIKTGYVSPTKNQIFTIGKELSKPFYDRLFFAGEHTQMAFFGYMEGALRSGERAAHTLMLQACGLLKKPARKSPNPPPQRPAPKSPSPPLVAHAAPTHETTAFEYETEIPLEKHSATDYPGEAESPFLDEELSVGEAKEEWGPRAAALASELPFLDTVKALEERPRSAIVPEVYEEVTNKPEAGGFHEREYEYETDSEGEHQIPHAFEEEQGTIVEPEFGELYSESSYLASDAFDDTEVSDNLTADAFVADNYGREYFVTFPQLGGLAAKKAIVLTPSNFENLVDLMLASDRKNFVIDAHGDPEGLRMPLARVTGVSATKRSLFILRGIENVRSLIRVAKESETIWGRASGTNLDRWRQIVEVLHSRTWQQMVGPGWPTVTPQVSGVDAAKSIVQSRINALVDSLYPGRVANKQDQVDRLIEKMLRLQARGIREIQFRACNIGRDSNSLSEFRKFFGADYLCAPDVRSGMGLSAPPSIDRRAVDGLGGDRRTQLFNMPSGRFAIRIIVSGLTFSVNCAADTQAAVGEWVATHIMANSSYRRGKLPIHFLQTQPPVFPLDKDYAAHIKCRSSFWESVVRGSELEGKEAPKDEEEESLDDKGAPLREDEMELESPEDLEELYSHVHEHELDLGKELAELKGTEDLESDEEELDWLIEDSGATEEEFDAGLGTTVLEERQLPAPKYTELRHFHMKKTLNVAGSFDTSAKASLMKPLEMMPAYIDPWLDDLLTDTSATGLQGLLSELMLGRWSNFLSPESVRDKKAHPTDKLYVALVDLTGTKLSKPEFAGWAPTEAVDGASIPKILALYALFQLRFDLNHLASAKSITKKADLLKQAENHWKSTGLAGRPSLGQLFGFVEESGKPVQVRFQRWLDAAQFDINGNCSVTRLMNGLGFDYIGSVALQSGLRHPARGGLWLGTTYECGDKKSTRWHRDPVPLIASCVAGGQSGHHLTALSAATYYTLLAQGRLVDEPNSRELMTRLKRGCSLSPGGFHNGLQALGGVTLTAQKCGLLRKCTHESIFVERDRFRYVAVALAKGGGVPFNLLIQDLDKIIQKRNP